MVAFVHLDAFAEDLGHGPGFGATLVALLGVGSTTGRVLGGLLSDRLGTFPVFLSMTSGTGVLFAVWPACRSKVAMAVLSLPIGLTFGAYTSLSPLVCSEIWGDAVVSEVVSVVSACGRAGRSGGLTKNRCTWAMRLRGSPADQLRASSSTGAARTSRPFWGVPS